MPVNPWTSASWVAGWLGARVAQAPVAQLDSAAGFYPAGCRFESCRGRTTWPDCAESKSNPRAIQERSIRIGDGVTGRCG